MQANDSWNAVNLLVAGVSAVSAVCVSLFYINQQLHGDIRKLTESALKAQEVNRELSKTVEMLVGTVMELKNVMKDGISAIAAMKETIAGLKSRR